MHDNTRESFQWFMAPHRKSRFGGENTNWPAKQIGLIRGERQIISMTNVLCIVMPEGFRKPLVPS